MLKTKGLSFTESYRALVALSGPGNVARFAAEKVVDLSGIPIRLSQHEQ